MSWKAPPKDNGCVTLHAYVAIKTEVYYNNQGPLAKRICEDRRKLEDMMPVVNSDCQVCEDAKYKVKIASTYCMLIVPRLSEIKGKFSCTSQGTNGD